MKNFFSAIMFCRPTLFRRPQTWVFMGIVLLGLGLRFTDLTDPPLDFHPMRQLRGALIARSMYYQMLPSADPAVRQKAIETTAILERQEPPIFERLVAFTYLAVGGEHLWIARLYSILFWTVGGLFFFDLARRMTADGTSVSVGGHPVNGALATLAYYLLLPFAVTASRTFQPEPFMAMWIAITLWVAYQWGETHCGRDGHPWRWSIATGLLAGWTLLVKVTAVYYLAPTLVVIVLTHWGLRQALRDLRVWAAAFLTTLIPASYYFFSIGSDSANWFSAWGLSFSYQLLQPRFYVIWLKFLDNLMDLTMLGLALLSLIFFLKPKDRWLALGMWIGYILFGLSFPYPIRTHEYYSLMLVPTVALSLAPGTTLVCELINRAPRLWRYFTIPVIILAIAYPSWLTYTGLVGVNYRDEIKGWQKMGAELPPGAIIGLTHDYGTRIGYYGWRLVQVWPTTADFAMLAQRSGGYSDDFDQMFEEKTKGMDYFLVTLMGELDAQPMLKSQLYDNYPLTDGDGYLLFDLRHRRTPRPQTP